MMSDSDYPFSYKQIRFLFINTYLIFFKQETRKNENMSITRCLFCTIAAQIIIIIHNHNHNQSPSMGNITPPALSNTTNKIEGNAEYELIMHKVGGLQNLDPL